MWKNSRMMKTLAPQRCMPRTSQPNVTSFVMCWIDEYACSGSRLVVHRQDHAGDRLDEEGGQRGRAERVRPAAVAGHLAEEEVPGRADEARPLLEPVERIEDDGLDLLLACGLAASAVALHVRISGIGQSQNSGPSTCWPGTVSAYFLISRVLARALDLGDAEGAAEDRWPSDDRVSRSGRARERAGRRCGCPPCRTGRRGTGSRSRPAARGVSRRRRSPCLSLTSSSGLVSTGPFGCTGQPRCAQRFERIVKLGGSAERSAVVADVGGAPRDLARPRDPRRRS